jgi:Uroporphyrinogen-III synthase HemD
MALITESDARSVPFETFGRSSDARYSAVIVTSANALRGIEPHLKGHRMLELPLFAVGELTAAAAAARRAGFTHVVSANGDAANLRDLVLASLRAKELKKADNDFRLTTNGDQIAWGSPGSALLERIWRLTIRSGALR